MSAKSEIMKHFPRNLKPREVQTNALSALEEHWPKATVFVINLPVASGKCHKLGQKVLMYDGSLKKIEEVEGVEDVEDVGGVEGVWEWGGESWGVNHE